MHTSLKMENTWEVKRLPNQHGTKFSGTFFVRIVELNITSHWTDSNFFQLTHILGLNSFSYFQW